jgi:prophage regulatory protein
MSLEKNVSFLHSAIKTPSLLRVSELEQLLPYKKSWIWLQVRKGAFPKPIRLSARCTVWRRDEIIAWLEGRMQQNPDAVDPS